MGSIPIRLKRIFIMEDGSALPGLGWDYNDLVAVNLYPIEETVANPNVTYADAIENIDIGDVTIIRAAAKNHERVTLFCDPSGYNEIISAIQSGEIPFAMRKQLAIKGFQITTHYDAMISGYLAND